MQKFFNIDFFLRLLPQEDNEFVMSEMLKKMRAHELHFGESIPGRTL